MWIKKIIIFSLFLPIALFAWKMESNTTTLPATTEGSSLWQSVTFAQTYPTVPLIFGLVDEGSGYDTDSPVVLRLRNVTTTGFEIVQVEGTSVTESTAEQGTHPSVNVHYVVIEEGNHTFYDGTRLLAGIHTTTSQQGKNITGTLWDTVTFSTAFNATPIVLAMIQGIENETESLAGIPSSPWMTTALRNPSSSSFQLTLERGESPDTTLSNNENIAYLVMEVNNQSSFTDSYDVSLIYETLLFSNNVKGWDNSCVSANFKNTYTNIPLVIGVQNSRNGGDGGWVRRCSLSSSKLGITIDEDQIVDNERIHTSEDVGVMIFERAFVYDSAIETELYAPKIELRMDECYWAGGANGITGDVTDNSSSLLHATSRHNATNNGTQLQKICRAGHLGNTYADRTLSDAVYYPNNLIEELNIGQNPPFSFSVWLYRENDSKWMAGVIRSSNAGWSDGWGVTHYSGSGDNIDFFVDDYTTYARTTLIPQTWTHIAGTYDGTNIKIYKDGTFQKSQRQTSYTAGVLPLSVGDDIGAISDDDRWKGYIDELKIWHRILTESEILNIYDNENRGLNYDGSTRICKPCNGATIQANTWEMISVPAELRGTSITLGDLLGDDMNGSLNDTWMVYQRTYSSTNNSSNYQALALTDVLEFGVGYWFASTQETFWDVKNINTLDYNSTNPQCPTTSCVEIDIKPVTLDVAVDDLLGGGSYRYTMNSFTGIQTPVDWADCRFVISDLDGANQEVLTPTDANATGYLNKQIWLYNPSHTDANSNGYTVCDDTSPGGCKLLPFNGFWLELHGKSKNKLIKLLIPQE